jgi:hypothetical protein
MGGQARGGRRCERGIDPGLDSSPDAPSRLSSARTGGGRAGDPGEARSSGSFEPRKARVRRRPPLPVSEIQGGQPRAGTSWRASAPVPAITGSEGTGPRRPVPIPSARRTAGGKASGFGAPAASSTAAIRIQRAPRAGRPPSFGTLPARRRRESGQTPCRAECLVAVFSRRRHRSARRGPGSPLP